MNLNIREMLPKERDYAYTQSYQLMSQSGCIALMRGDFGNGGRTFYPEFDSVIKEFYKVGILADRDSMLEYCCARPDGRFMGNFSREYGYRVDTDKYTYLLRCIPAPGDNNFYCYAYVSDLLNSHMEKAAQGIRFIDSRYKELFRLPRRDRKEHLSHLRICPAYGGLWGNLCPCRTAYPGNVLFHFTVKR